LIDYFIIHSPTDKWIHNPVANQIKSNQPNQMYQ